MRYVQLFCTFIGSVTMLRYLFSKLRIDNSGIFTVEQSIIAGLIFILLVMSSDLAKKRIKK